MPDHTPSPPIDDVLGTEAERSGFRRTGSYAEVAALCLRFSLDWPRQVRLIEFGTTPEQRPLLALLVTRCGTLDADELRRRNVPLLMVQAGIHPGESDGKDAGFIVLRELLRAAPESSPAAAALGQIAVLFVPVLSPDGHERIGPWHRVNQNGPEEMGWRANAQNLNLNRDYSKLDAPEMRAVLQLMQQYDPLLCVDLHVANGADFEHDVSIQVEPLHLGAQSLRPTGTVIRDAVISDLAAQGSLPLTFYPVLARQDDPAGGFVDYIFTPRYSTGYWPLRNRFTMLVETHAWKEYAWRVQATGNVIRSLVTLTAANGPQWRSEVAAADAAATALAGNEVAIDHALGERSELIDFRGWAYTRASSDISGALMTTYHRGQKQAWRVPLRGDVQPVRFATVPRGGYYVAAGYALEIAPRLAAHGIAYETLATPLAAQALQSFRASAVRFDGEPNEGRWRTSLQGEWKDETIDLAAGALFIPARQPLCLLVMALLEPLAPDSFATWGFFNAVFERKEYMEAYVAEQEARRMLAADPALAAQFKQRLANDAAFAADPAARLDFFYQHHPSWDTRLGVLPVYRCETAPAHRPAPAR